MDKSFKIAGIVLAAWIALGLLGWIFDFMANWMFWVAVVAGAVWVVAAITGRGRTRITGRSGLRTPTRRASGSS